MVDFNVVADRSRAQQILALYQRALGARDQIACKKRCDSFLKFGLAARRGHMRYWHVEAHGVVSSLRKVQNVRG